MKRIFLAFLAAASIASAAETKTYRVHFSSKGSGHDVTVLAESSSEARRMVAMMYDKAVVTGVREVGPAARR